MKLWLKTVICITLVFIITVSSIFSGVIQVRKAEASFVPFIVENAEWLLALLAGFGISFATQSDALAGVHDFAYKLDSSAYTGLQNYIEGQKVKNVSKLVIGDLVTNGLLSDIYDYVNDLPITLAQLGGTLLIDYLIPGNTENIIDGDYTVYNILPYQTLYFNMPYNYVEGNPSSILVSGSNGTIFITFKSNGINVSSNPSSAANYFDCYDGEILPVSIQAYDGANGNRSARIYIKGEAVYSKTIYNVSSVRILNNSNIFEQEIPISATLTKDEGVSIDENIGALPLPSDGISSPWDNTVIVPPSSISEGVNLSPQDVLQQPAIDNFNNPVLDNLGNPVYEPVPQTWPNTQNPAYPPWPLSPDIGGVAEGTGVIGGILENIRDWVGDIGTYLTTDLPRILTTDLPLAIGNIFNGPPPGDEDNNDVTDKMNDFKLPDLFLLFLGVILACIRLMIRFITFLASLLLKPADGSIIPDGMKQSLNFLKNWNIGLPISFYTLFSSLMTFFFGLRMIKYIKIFVANVHGGITQTYDPREFNDNEVYNEWSKSGYKTEYSEYRKIYDNWKDSNSNLPWKGYLKREARGRKW